MLARFFHCSLLRSAVFFIITDFIRLEFRAPLNLIVFECMCVYVDFLLKMHKIRTFNSDDAAEATTVPINCAQKQKPNGVGFKFRHADLISSDCVSMHLSLYVCALVLVIHFGHEKAAKIVTMELCLRLCNENMRSLNNAFFS